METSETTSPEAVEATESTDVAMTVEESAETEQVIEQETTYADGKFKSVGDLENSYKELQSTFSKKLGAFEGAPENYEFNEGFVTDENQELADMLSGWGAENQLSNDGLNSLVSQYNEHLATQQGAAIDAEFGKLGDDAQVRIDNARSFLDANLGEEQTRALAANMNTAGAIEAVEALIAMTKQPKVAAQDAQPNLNADKIHEMRFALDEHGNRRMEDPAYRQRVLKMEQGIH